MTKPIIFSLSHGRNEAEHLGACLDSINKQTLKPECLIYVDDASDDESIEIAVDHHTIVCPLLGKHESWVLNPLLATVYNEMFKCVYRLQNSLRLPKTGDYYFIGGCDAVYPTDYLEKLETKMRANPKLVIASGIFRDEPCGSKFARGLGRLIKADFWDTYVKQVPVKHDWETEPNRIAWTNGYEVASFPDIRFDGRPTGARR